MPALPYKIARPSCPYPGDLSLPGRFESSLLANGRRLAPGKSSSNIDVAAQGFVVHVRPVDLDLPELVGDVTHWNPRRTDDRQLAYQRIGAAQAVDLPPVR
jgi:hypothetical protein